MHFEELLNRPTPERPPDIQLADIDPVISCEIPTKTEISRAFSILKNGKATGSDEISTEADIKTSIAIPDNLFKKIYE